MQTEKLGEGKYRHAEKMLEIWNEEPSEHPCYYCPEDKILQGFRRYNYARNKHGNQLLDNFITEHILNNTVDIILFKYVVCLSSDDFEILVFNNRNEAIQKLVFELKNKRGEKITGWHDRAVTPEEINRLKLKKDILYSF